MYELYIRKHLVGVFKKLKKKDPKQYGILKRKLEKILRNPFQFKPLRTPLKGKWRVHIAKSFVLIYSIDRKNSRVILEDYAHHDEVYVE